MRIKILSAILAISLFIPFPAKSQSDSSGMRIWFNNPAANWNEALPVGNGRLGAMIFGVLRRSASS